MTENIFRAHKNISLVFKYASLWQLVSSRSKYEPLHFLKDTAKGCRSTLVEAKVLTCTERFFKILFHGAR